MNTVVQLPMQVCRTCGEDKPANAFGKNGKRRDGSYYLHLDCRQCINLSRLVPRMTPEEKTENTEREITGRLSAAHAAAIHRVAFDPDNVTPADLKLAFEVYATFSA